MSEIRLLNVIAELLKMRAEMPVDDPLRTHITAAILTTLRYLCDATVVQP